MTILALLKDAGAVCASYLTESCAAYASAAQADEIWSFVYMKEKRVPAAKAFLTL